MVKVAFTRAEYKEPVVERIASLGAKAVEQFEALELEAESKALARVISAKSEKQSPAEGDIDVVFDAFARMCDPTHDRHAGKAWKYLHWICASYLISEHNDQPIMVEDFYKVSGDLRYFEALSGQLYKDKKPNGIDHKAFASGFSALGNLLHPYRQKQQAKEVVREELRMTPEKRRHIDSETTLIYEGPEGRVVMPHTWHTSKYWGSRTKWCITERDTSSYFEMYNRDHPIIFYLPSPDASDFEACAEQEYFSFKFAAVGDSLYDEKDYSPRVMPDCLKRLVNAAKQEHQNSPAVLKYLERHGLTEEILNFNAENEQSKQEQDSEDIPEYLREYPEEWHEYFKELNVNNGHTPEPPAEFVEDRAFFLGALKQSGFVMKYAPEAFKGDREIALAAVQKTGFALNYVSEELQDDVEIVGTAVKESAWGLQYASERLKDDDDIVDLAMSNNAIALKFASARFRADRAFMKDLLYRSGWCLQYASDELKNDREIVKIAVSPDKVRGMCDQQRSDFSFPFQNASEELRDDREIALIAVQSRGQDLEYVSERLRGDKDVVLAAVQNDGIALRYVPEYRWHTQSLRSDPDIALAAVQQNPKALAFVDRCLLNYEHISDPEEQEKLYAFGKRLAMLSVERDGRMFKKTGDLQNDIDVILAAVEQNIEALKDVYFSPHKEAVVEAIRKKTKPVQAKPLAFKDVARGVIERLPQSFLKNGFLRASIESWAERHVKSLDPMERLADVLLKQNAALSEKHLPFFLMSNLEYVEAVLEWGCVHAADSEDFCAELRHNRDFWGHGIDVIASAKGALKVCKIKQNDVEAPKRSSPAFMA